MREFTAHGLQEFFPCKRIQVLGYGFHTVDSAASFTRGRPRRFSLLSTPVKLVDKIRLGSKPPLVTRIARTGLSTRLWIMDSKYWIPEDLKRFQSLVGFDPDSKPRDSIFTSKNFPDSRERKFIGFRIPYMGRRNTQMDQLSNLRLSNQKFINGISFTGLFIY